jgi:putative iron-dependent peroxidase
MTTPQPGIYALGSRSHLHLEFDLGGDAEDLRSAIANIQEALGPVAGVNAVFGFGKNAWTALSPGAVPDDLVSFEPIVGADGFTHPSAQHDVWIWLHGDAPDALFDLGRTCQKEMRGVATLAAERSCFAYGAALDMSGFEDGTENPPTHEAPEVASIPEGPCVGGSFVLLQRWVHDLEAFEAKSPEEQEKVFGRTKIGSIELDEADAEPGSHVQRVVIEDDEGEELEVWRRSAPYGTLSEHGLMFLAFSQDRDRLHQQLERMAGVDDGVLDLITTYSTPVASAWYLAPPVELL